MNGWIRRISAAMLAIALTAITSFPSVADGPVAGSPAAGSTHYGDLMHLVNTATGALPVSFVSPGEGQASSSTSTGVTLSTVSGAGVELRVNDEIVSLKQLGKRTVNIKTGETQYFYYGVSLKAGPNTLVATALGAGDARGTPVTQTFYGPGDPATIRAEFATPLIADGRTPSLLYISMTDRWGHAVAPGNRLNVRILRGDARFSGVQTGRPAAMPSAPPDVVTPPTGDPRAPNAVEFEAPTTPGGFQRIEVVPGLVAGALLLSITVGDVAVTRSFYLAPNVRAPFVNGLITIGAGSMPASVDGDGINDNGGARRQRVAVYASGKIGRDTLLTAAYESQNRLSPVSSFGPYVDDPNERPYLTYGDSSHVESTIHSADHLYARIDRATSHLMWGQFNASIGENPAGSYQALLSGADASIALGRTQAVRIGGFTARNQMAFAQTTLPLTGLASLIQPLKPDIVVGSEYLSLVALDRHTGAIASTLPLIRNVDYTIDYATGVLRFINVPLPYDANFNPQVVNIQYQYQGPGVESRTTGASLKIALDAAAKTNLQFGYVNDASGTQNFSLFAAALARAWSNGSWTIGSARSNGYAPVGGTTGPTTPAGSSGLATYARLDVHGANDTLGLNYQRTGAGYNDPFGGLSSPGLTSIGANYLHRMGRKDTLALTFTGQANDFAGNTSRQNDASLLYTWHPSGKLSFLAGFDRHQQSATAGATPAPVASGAPAPVPLSDTTQLQAHVGMQYQPSRRLTLGVDRFQTLSGSDVGSTQPTQTMADLTYDLGDKGSVFLRELWSSQPAATFANSTSTLTTGVASTHTTEIGFQRALTPSTTINSDYVINGTGSATNIYSVLGVQQKFRLGKHFGGSLAWQNANSVGVGAQGFSLWGATLGYANGDKMRASVAYQTRTGASGGSTISASMAGHLTDGLAVVGTIARAFGNGQRAISDRISLAYRPVNNDRLTTLLDYQRANGSDAFVGTGVGSVISFQQLYRPWNGFEIAGSFAYKLDGDAEYLARTNAMGLRVRQNIGQRFDIGAEVQRISIPSIATARSTNLAVEGGYQVGNSARVALGYNFSGSADPSLAGHPQRRGIYVTFTTLVDRIFGWGKR